MSRVHPGQKHVNTARYDWSVTKPWLKKDPNAPYCMEEWLWVKRGYTLKQFRQMPRTERDGLRAEYAEYLREKEDTGGTIKE